MKRDVSEVLKGADGEFPPEDVEKLEVLCQVMIASQPEIEGFRGDRHFSNGMLDKSKEELKNKLAEIDANDATKSSEDAASEDIYSRVAEPILGYIFSSKERSIFRSRDSIAFLASEYDDVFNGTDIVLAVENKDGGNYITCALDVSTATDAYNVQEKFRRNTKWHGNTPPFCSYLKFCSCEGQNWTATAAPHFTLGMMPSRIHDALGKIHVENGILAGRDADEATEFKLLSEMREQILMQKKLSPNGYNEILDNLLPAINASLYNICGVEGETKEERKKDFSEKYKKMKEKHREDLVYRNIIDACARPPYNNTGGNANRAFMATKKEKEKK